MSHKRYSILFRAIATVLVCLFLVNDNAFGFSSAYSHADRTALAPPLATKPPCEIVRNPNGSFDVITNYDVIKSWDKKTVRSVKSDKTPGNAFRNRWAFVDVGYLIGQMLALAREHKIQNPKEILIPLIKKHIRNRKGEAEILLEGFDIDGIEEAREGGQGLIEFHLPIRRNGSIGYYLRYYLASDGKSFTTISLHDGPPVYIGVAEASQRAIFEKGASTLGGKGSWSKITEELAGKIGFNTPRSEYITIQEAWNKFIEANKVLVDKGNALIASENRLSNESIAKLRRLMQRFVFTPELEELVRSRAGEIKGVVIARSSGRWEDSFLRNLAGIFTSPKRRDERLAFQAVKEIFKQAITTIWISQNEPGGAKIEGIPNILSADEGFGVLIQPFLDFDASGTAMSDFYGHTSIEAVIGDAATAVRPVYANMAQFLFKKGDPVSFEYNPSFLTMPYEFKLKGVAYKVTEARKAMEDALSKYPKINGRPSPLSESEARELNRVVNALEEEIGAPLDIEWGFLNGKLYIIQVRPIIGDYRKAPVVIDPDLVKRTPIAQTPIAIGATEPAGFTGKMVLFGNGVKIEDIEAFEREFGKAYIRVQDDAASAVLGTTTKAKVLVDPMQGSRQAHNITLIHGRIANGEVVYCNGPILKERLAHSELEFIPHPVFEGIWVSRREATYFSDGLRGFFFMADTSATEMPEEMSERQALLTAFDEMAYDIWFKDDSEFKPDIDIVLPRLLKETIFKNEMSKAHYSLALSMIFGSTDPVGSIERDLFNGVCTESDLDSMQPRIELLEESLSHPLYPHAWESPCMEKFRNLLVLKGIQKAVTQRKKAQREIGVPDKYRAVFLDADSPKYSLIEMLHSCPNYD